MRFLVTLDGSDIGVGMPPERLGQVVEQMVVPSIEQLTQWEQEGRIYGGGIPLRGVAFSLWRPTQARR